MERNSNQVTRVQELETTMVFALFFLFLWVRFHEQVYVYLSIVFLLSALLFPALSRTVALAWNRFSGLVAAVNSRIILTVIFYLVLVPLARLYRLFNKDPLHLLSTESVSYYSERNHKYSKADLDKMW